MNRINMRNKKKRKLLGPQTGRFLPLVFLPLLKNSTSMLCSCCIRGYLIIEAAPT